MDRFRAQNYKIIERYASLIQYFLYLEFPIGKKLPLWLVGFLY